MLFRRTSFPSVHFGQGFSMSPLATFNASAPALPSIFFEGHSLLTHTSCGRFPFRMTVTIGNEHSLHSFPAGLMSPEGRLIVTSQSGYLLHAINPPNFPRPI